MMHAHASDPGGRRFIAMTWGGLATACERVAMATVAAPADLLDVTTPDALQEKKKLRKHFARFDIVFFLICTLVGVDTLGAVASNGPQAFTWLIFLAILFFVPYALLTAELGAAFPEEGGQRAVHVLGGPCLNRAHLPRLRDELVRPARQPR
jgi:hypothetical protein